MKIRYVGPHHEVHVPNGPVFPRDVDVDVDASLARSLLEQDTFTRKPVVVKAPTGD